MPIKWDNQGAQDGFKTGNSIYPVIGGFAGGLHGGINDSLPKPIQRILDPLGLHRGKGAAGAGVDQTHQLAYQSDQASNFSDRGVQDYGRYGAEVDALNQQLRGQTMGQGLVSSEQLRQGLQQNVAAQRSMAAGASPANQAMAARTAMMNAGRMGGAMSGQAALAAMQERDLAQKLLAQNQLQQQQSGMNIGLQSRLAAMQGVNNIEQARTARYTADAQASKGGGLLGGLGGLGSGLSMLGGGKGGGGGSAPKAPTDGPGSEHG